MRNLEKNMNIPPTKVLASSRHFYWLKCPVHEDHQFYERVSALMKKLKLECVLGAFLPSYSFFNDRQMPKTSEALWMALACRMDVLLGFVQNANVYEF